MAELSYNQKIIADPHKNKYKALIGAVLGYIFDAQDFMVLALVIPLLVKTWGISLASAGLISTATIFGAALSGYLWGPMIDKFGRKRMLILCLVWFGVFTFFCGFATDYMQLIILRFIAGIGLGGEWVIGAALISEFFPPEQRARATSAVQSGWPLGYALALGVNAYLVPTYGWQVLFFSGILSLIAAVYIAVLVPESPAWLKAKINKTEGKESVSKTDVKAATWTDLFKGANLKTTLLAFGLCASCLVSYWGAGSWIPAYLSAERGLNVKNMSGYLMILNVGGFIGYYFYGFLADKLGRRANFIFGSLASAAVMLIWINLSSPTAILWMAGVFGFITYGYWGPLAAFVSEQFPTGVRGIGTAFAYASGRMMSALAPFLMGGIASKYSLGLALGLVSVIYAVGAIFGYFMKETRDTIIVD
ncbi:transporter [Desulfocucumis palustris]|uniref:Transporter n=1 Tax=Desulfocucumis palustris TaxID=1898651 RepID=A0A2L2XIJ0_9FIRM|nr:MFS transporter [Desulfocucumis palustris]GBF33721.1 transporter [Desulfocucumis palustris]